MGLFFSYWGCFAIKGAREAHERRNGRFLRDFEISGTVLTEIGENEKKQAHQGPANRPVVSSCEAARVIFAADAL
jgi:hypothetical protein